MTKKHKIVCLKPMPTLEFPDEHPLHFWTHYMKPSTQSAALPPLKQAVGNFNIPALRILSEISSSLASENNVESLLERFLGTMVKLAGAQAGAVRVVTADGKHLRLVGAMGLPAEVIEQERFVEIGCGICGEAARSDTSSCSSDVQACAIKTTQSNFFGTHIKRVVAVPLRHQGKMLGVYNLFMGADELVPEDVALLFNSIGEHLGLALENARLMRENMRATLMNERQLLANEIHDSIAQTLAYAKMRLTLLSDAMDARDCDQAEKYYGDLREAMDDAYTSLRSLLANFRNPMDARGLMPALQDMVIAFRQKSAIELDFESDMPDLGLTPEQEVQVFHIIQEALSNISKHSRATRAKLSLAFCNDEFRVTVEDNGVGALADYKPGKTHFGLNIMRERAQRLNGHIHLYQGAGSGTRIDLTFPALQCRQQGME